MTRSIHAPGAFEANIQRGLAGAQAVLDEAGVTSAEGLWAQARREKGDISGFDDEKEPIKRQQMAAIALYRARRAAEDACFKGCRTPPKGCWHLRAGSHRISLAVRADVTAEG